jgi:glycosyltransferase involved in cell wall biosynthesis
MSAEPAREFLTTRRFTGREAWTSRCETIDPASLSLPALVRRLVREAPTYRAVIVDGSVGAGELYSELLAAIAIRRRRSRRRTPIVLGECQWKLSGAGPDRVATRLGVRALDGPEVAYCVLSRWERDRFGGTWGVDPDRVFATPYCHTLSDADLAAPTSETDGVFAGGNSMRDYLPLVDVARGLDERFALATKLLDGPLPPNVTAAPVPERRFFELMRNARVVVVPLAERSDRTAGQQTYLNAMALGKPTIVTDSPGVCEYVEDGRTGIVVAPGDAAALAQGLRWVLDPANADAVRTMCEAARETALTRFSPERFAQSMLDVAERMARIRSLT